MALIMSQELVRRPDHMQSSILTFFPSTLFPEPRLDEAQVVQEPCRQKYLPRLGHLSSGFELVRVQGLGLLTVWVTV